MHPKEAEAYSDKAFGTEGLKNTTRKLEYAVYCALFEDVLETLVKYGCNPELSRYPDEPQNKYNYFARMYLYGGNGVQPETIPNYPETTAKDNVVYSKYSMELFLSLWVNFVQQNNPLRECKLRIFKSWLGDPKYLNNGSKNKAGMSSIQFSKGVVAKSRRQDANDVAAFVPPRYMFSNFFDKSCISQTVNLDVIEAFQAYQKKVFVGMWETKKKRKSPADKTPQKKPKPNPESTPIAEKDNADKEDPEGPTSKGKLFLRLGRKIKFLVIQFVCNSQQYYYCLCSNRKTF
jgi:hypothetical protein